MSRFQAQSIQLTPMWNNSYEPDQVNVVEDCPDTISIKKLKISDNFIMLFSSVGGSESFVNMSPDDSAYDW